MSTRDKVTMAVGAAIAIAGAVIVVIGDEKPLDPQKKKVLEPSKLAKLRDGGIGYMVRVAAEGGSEWRLTAPDCVRRPVGARPTDCQRATFDLGGKPVMVEPGELNRFPAAEAAGAGCQLVACSVYAGEDADAEEADRVRERKGDTR